MALDVRTGPFTQVALAAALGAQRARYLPIAEHGLIGDLHTVALVGTDGTIDWYANSFRTRSAEAYERLLHDAMAGDQTLFLREDAVERSWQIVAPILDASGTVHPYAAGTWGPSAADELIAPRAWRPV